MFLLPAEIESESSHRPDLHVQDVWAAENSQLLHD